MYCYTNTPDISRTLAFPWTHPLRSRGVHRTGHHDQAASDLYDSHELMPLLGSLLMMTSSNTGGDDWQGALAARYPLARSVGFECFGGWQPILAHLFERLESAVAEFPVDGRRDFHVERIRQKFGCLQVRVSDEGTAEVRAAIEEAENASVVSCEVCGAPGELADRRGWTAVRCTRHEDWSRLDDLL